MTAKQKIRYAVDLGMTTLLPLLMAYSLVGETAHEWLGVAMLALFAVHHCLNRAWLKNLPRGRYSGFRILQTALAALHACDGLIAEAPVYYNCMAAQALLVIDRLCCTFACKDYPLGPKKKIGAFLTCTGSDVDEMEHHVQLIVDLPSIQRSVEAERTKVFTGCASRDTCKNTPAYLDRASAIARWVCE